MRVMMGGFALGDAHGHGWQRARGAWRHCVAAGVLNTGVITSASDPPSREIGSRDREQRSGAEIGSRDRERVTVAWVPWAARTGSNASVRRMREE
jgi:hypothetical protein